MIQCELGLKQYDEAEKFVKRQAKKNPEESSYNVMLGYIYKSKGDTSKARQVFINTIEKLSSDQSKYLSLGASFEQYQYYDMAIATYKKGQKELGRQYSFRNELANVFFYTRDYKNMFEEYLALLEEDENFMSMVEARIQALIINDTDNNLRDILKEKLITRIQKRPDYVPFAELLVWIFTQEKDFGAALVQAKAIDLRNKETGDRVFSLGETAAENTDYTVASDCFQYVIDKGKLNPLYEDARSLLLITLNKKILTNPGHTTADVLNLEKLLDEAITELGVTPKTTSLLIAKAHLQAFYLKKDSSAIKLLEDALEIKTLPLVNKSDIRMELGDIYLYTDDVWEANLVYAKLESDREGSPIAHEAKFRRARIAYFVGDFEWAGALLSVLKAATSKLTSNDAFELSLLLSDNMQDDTVFTALQMFARADFLSYKNNDSLALITYDSIPKLFPGNQLEDEILMRKSNIYIKHEKFDLAASNLQQVVDRFSSEIYADDAIFTLAGLYETVLNDKQKAMDLYKKLITDFTNSVFVIEARVKYRQLRGDKIN